MAIPDSSKVTLRGDVQRPLTYSEMDENFDQLKEVVDQSNGHTQSISDNLTQQKLQDRSLLKRQCAEAGLTLVSGSFEEGASVTLKTEVVWQQATGKVFAWFQDAVKNVVAGSTPATSGGIGAGAWVDRTDVTLRSELISQDGSSKVGFKQAGTGAVATNVQSKLRETMSVKDFGAVLSTAVASADTAGGRTVYVPFGAYTVDANLIVPSTVTLRFHGGAMVTVAAGVTLDIRGEIEAPSTEIFDGHGAVILDGSPSGYNLAWFKTANGYINDRFDFAKRGMASFNNKVVRVPAPRLGAAGTVTVGKRTYWQFSAPLAFSDAQNSTTWFIEGEFSAANDCDAFMLFDDASKPENIYFYGPIQAIAAPTQTVNFGIDMRAASRVSFFGQVVLNGFKTSWSMGGANQSAAVENIYAPEVQAAFFSVAALDILGKTGHSCQDIMIGNLRATAAQTTGLPAARLSGQLRDVTINNAYYATDTAKNGYTANDAEDVVVFDATSDGSILHCKVGAIYQASANNGLRIKSTASDKTKIADVEIDRIFGKYNGSAANLDYCRRVTINGVENASSVTVGSNCEHVKINATSGLKSVSDSGAYTLVNGVGKQTRGGNVPPAPAVPWPVGAFIRETSDNRCYVRISNEGTASDFLSIRPVALKSTTGNRPTLGSTDAGYLYFDTTLDSDGKPIWWNGTAWVDASGAVV